MAAKSGSGRSMMDGYPVREKIFFRWKWRLGDLISKEYYSERRLGYLISNEYYSEWMLGDVGDGSPHRDRCGTKEDAPR